MLSGSRPHPRPSLRPAAGAVLLLLALLPWPALAEDEPTACFTTRQNQGDSPIGDGLDQITVDGEDLWVAVQWGDDPSLPDAALVLATPSGTVTGAWPAPRSPGERTEQHLAGALGQTGVLGFQYVLRLEDAEGLRAQASLRAIVDCPQGELCRYRLVRGLKGGPITVSEAFWNALAEARDTGAPDLIGHVREHHPELAGEIPGFVWQMQISEEIPEKAPGTDCSCRWIDLQNLVPQGTVSLEAGDGSPPTHVFGWNHAGAHLLSGLQTTGGEVELELGDTRGRSSFGIQLLCTRAEGEAVPTRYPTSWPSLPVLALGERRLQSCPAPCMPVIEHRAELLGCAEAKALSRAGLPARASSKIVASVGLRPLAAVGGGAIAEVGVADGERLRSREAFEEEYSGKLEAMGAIAGAEAEAALLVDADEPGTLFSYGYASAAVKYLLWFEASAGCPEVPDYGGGGLDLINNDQHEGGVAIDRWEDP